MRDQAKYFIWQRIFRINSRARWPVHFTSKVTAPHKVTLGRASYPGDMPGCYIQADNGIVIGDYCLFGPNCGLVSANHDPMNLKIQMSAEPITLGHHCWVGMGAIVLPGVVLGDYTTVAANAVVTKSFPEGYCILAGNPARVVKTFGENGRQPLHCESNL